MNKGFLKTLIYYLIGLGLAGLSYSIVGHPYIHGPGLHHIVIFLTFFGGFGWLLIAAIQYFNGRKSENLRGIIFSNLFMCLCFVLFMAYIIRDATDNRGVEKNEHIIIIEESGDTTTMYHDGSPVYMKVKDSVLLNFIDSTKINLYNVKRIKK